MQNSPGVWAAVRLLTSLDTYDVDLVNTHAAWILRGDPDAALEMFSHLTPPLPISSVLQLLKRHAPDLAVGYLESVRGPPSEPALPGFERYDQDLAYLYLAGARDSGAPTHATCLQSLRALVQSSDALDALELLHRLPPSPAFYEIKALLLGSLGRHLEAIRVLVHRLKDVRAAESYCARVLEKALGAGGQLLRRHGSSPSAAAGAAPESDIFLTLIQVLLEEESSGGEYQKVQRPPLDRRWQEVAAILSRRHDAVPPLQALDILPDQLPLAHCLAFMEGAVWGASEERRRVSVASHLRQAEQHAAWLQLAAAKSRSCVVSAERACCLCHKRLGAAALVAYPNGSVAHFSCYKRASNGGIKS
jgi:Vam6/Vps39-like protein vacuolar protein sorting-associated protein 39